MSQVELNVETNFKKSRIDMTVEDAVSYTALIDLATVTNGTHASTLCFLNNY
jgi:hypothetical protein